MTYELWDRESGNRLGEFPTREAALELVREIVEDEGAQSAECLVLGVEEAGRPLKIAAGRELIQLAQNTRLSAAG